MGTSGNIESVGNKNYNSTLEDTEKDKRENKVESSILLSYIGPQGREIYNTFTFWLQCYCTKIRELLHSLLRYKFLTYKKKEGQSIDKFMTQLKKLSSDCEFGKLKNSRTKDTVAIGVIDESLGKK